MNRGKDGVKVMKTGELIGKDGVNIEKLKNECSKKG